MADYIKQIKVGNGANDTYDIAVANSITFYSGTADQEGRAWDGSTTLSVIIPTVADIVQSPVVFAGTVGSNGTISYASGFGSTAQRGYLVYIQAPCTFEGEACEAGDMAVYDGDDWHVISGENQVAIVGTAQSGVVAKSLTSTAQSVLTVEGKSLELAIDYASLRGDLAYTVTKNASALSVDLSDGLATIASTYVGLSSSTTALSISKAESLTYGYELADGTVDFGSTRVLVSDNITLTSGSFSSAVLNSTSIPLTVDKTISIAAGSGSDYVATVDAIKGASIIPATNSEDGQLTYVASISSSDGTEFLKDIHTYDSTKDGATPAFTIPGVVSFVSASNTFATGLSDDENGALVSGITVGSVSLTGESTFVTGLSSGSDVITSVSFGSLVTDTEKSWFVTGLGNTESASGDVVSSVNVNVALESDATGGSNAVISALVSNHVLSFDVSKFQTPVKLSNTSSVSYKSFTSAGVKLSSDWGTTASGLATGSISLTQASTTVSRKSLTTGVVTPTFGADEKFAFGSASAKEYSATTAYAKISTVVADVTKGAYAVTNSNVSAWIPSDKVVVSLTSGSFPELSFTAPSGTLSASVSPTLATSTYSWTGIDTTKSVDLTTYTLVSDSAANAGAIEVGAAGTVSVDGYVQISASTYVTDIDVTLGGTSINA